MSRKLVSLNLIKGIFYHDIIYPFSYFYVKQRYRLEKRADILPGTFTEIAYRYAGQAPSGFRVIQSDLLPLFWNFKDLYHA